MCHQTTEAMEQSLTTSVSVSSEMTLVAALSGLKAFAVSFKDENTNLDFFSHLRREESVANSRFSSKVCCSIWLLF